MCFGSEPLWESDPRPWEWGGREGSDQVGVSEPVLVAAGGELLRPVDDGRFEEAAAAQLEERRQVPHHAQTADRPIRRGGSVSGD